MSTIRVVIDREEYQTRDPYPDDKWDRGDTAGHILSVNAYITSTKVVHPSADKYWYGLSELFELNVNRGDTVYAIIVDYNTGDTFGHDGNQAKVVACFDNEDQASELIALLREEKGFSVEFMGDSYYVGWNGYFESLNSLEIYPLTVL